MFPKDVAGLGSLLSSLITGMSWPRLVLCEPPLGEVSSA